MLGDSLRRRSRSTGQRPGKPGRRRAAGGGWRRWVPLLILAGSVPFVIGYALAVFVLFPAPPLAAAGIPVPELVGVEAGEAGRRLGALGLGPVEETQLPHPEQPPGVVIAQSPLPGQQLRSGSRVRLAVSTGAPHATVPDVIGFEEERAARLLSRVGFDVERATEPAAVASGRVLRTDPPPGADRALPARVRLIVSAGPEDGAVPADTLGAAGR